MTNVELFVWLDARGNMDCTTPDEADPLKATRLHYQGYRQVGAVVIDRRKCEEMIWETVPQLTHTVYGYYRDSGRTFAETLYVCDSAEAVELVLHDDNARIVAVVAGNPIPTYEVTKVLSCKNYKG